MIADAVWNQRRIEVRYRRWVAPTDVTRVVKWHGIVLKGGKWYVVAVCDGALRTYRISQVLSLTTLEEGLKRLAGFSLPTYWAAHIAAFPEGLQQGEATIRLSPDGRMGARSAQPGGVGGGRRDRGAGRGRLGHGGRPDRVADARAVLLPRAGGRRRGAGAGEPAGADGGRGGGHGPGRYAPSAATAGSGIE